MNTFLITFFKSSKSLVWVMILEPGMLINVCQTVQVFSKQVSITIKYDHIILCFGEKKNRTKGKQLSSFVFSEANVLDEKYPSQYLHSMH